MISLAFNNLLLATVAVAASPQAEVQSKIDGQAQTLSGRVIELTDQQLLLETAQGRVTIKRTDLKSIKPSPDKPSPEDRQPPAGPRTTWIELVDTSLIAAEGFVIDRRTAKVKLPDSRTFDLKKRDIKSVRFHPQDKTVARLWQRFCQSDVSGDQIVIRKGPDRIDAIEGVVRKIDDKVVIFELDGDEIPVPLAKVHGLIYYQLKGRQLSEAQSTIRLTDGSRLNAAKFILADQTLQITTTAGLRLDWPWNEIKQFGFSSDDAIYLSDIDPQSSTWAPYLSPSKSSTELHELFGPRRDQALFGGELRLPSLKTDGSKYVAYKKGLAIHSRTKLIYRLPAGYKSFQAIAGIDSRVRPTGNVRLTILTGEKQLFDRQLSGADKPEVLNLDIRGAARLTIIVDFGDDLDIADHLNLCEARIVK